MCMHACMYACVCVHVCMCAQVLVNCIQQPLDNAVSLTAPKQWNSLPSAIHHIHSSHALQAALKTHLNKQYQNKLFQIVFLLAPHPHPPTLPHPSSHSVHILSVHVSMCVGVGNTIL